MYVCMVWYGMVWYVMVWYGMVCNVMQCNAMQCNVCMYVCDICVRALVWLHPGLVPSLEEMQHLSSRV